jgi:hypothetical protein
VADVDESEALDSTAAAGVDTGAGAEAAVLVVVMGGDAEG